MKQWILENCFRKDGRLTSLATNYRWFEKRKYFEEYYKILEQTKFLDDSATLLERFYCILNDIVEPPKCKNCDKPVNFYGTLKGGYYTYCTSLCSQYDPELNKIKIENYKKTCMNKYGVDNTSKTEFVREKLRGKHEKPRYVYPTEYLDQLYNYHVDNEIPITVLSQQIGLTSSALRLTLLRRGYDVKKFANSYVERTVHEFLKQKNIDFVANDRKMLKGKELDIYFPDHKFAVEINGLYWHCTARKPKYHMLEKYKKCEKIGIKLFQFFDFEVTNKFNIVTSLILHELGMNEEISIKDVRVSSITNEEISDFFKENYLKDIEIGDFNLCLKMNNEIVAAITIRIADDKREILGYAMKNFLNIRGGFDLLMNIINKNNSLMSIDKRFFIIPSSGGELVEGEKNKPTKYFFNREGYSLEDELNISERDSFYIFDCGSKNYQFNTL